jgi:hypothetical protein
VSPAQSRRRGLRGVFFTQLRMQYEKLCNKRRPTTSGELTGAVRLRDQVNDFGLRSFCTSHF